MKVIKTGSKGKTVIGNIEGIITGICMRDNSLMYEFSYFVNGKRECYWLYHFELRFDIVEKRQAGFRREPEEVTQFLID